ncbi:MAG: ParB/RepB/Spo0J family partition protein [Kiritimatiellae bacterium]|nr:ParB/RepB/Spo0J family partition protein [Kiritimatiellia bacterium]
MARRSLGKKGRTADAERQEQGRQEQQGQGRRELRMVAVGDLAPAPWNARGEITPESVADLTASIKTLGLIEPLVASEGAGGLTLIAGHRRLAACREAGMGSVPVWVMEGVSADRARRMTLIENLQREDADPLMESELAWSLVNGGMTEAEIAAETGRGQRWVARRLRLSNLSMDWRARVRAGEAITTDCLEHIAAYPISIQERLRKEKGRPPQREGPMYIVASGGWTASARSPLWAAESLRGLDIGVGTNGTVHLILGEYSRDLSTNAVEATRILTDGAVSLAAKITAAIVSSGASPAAEGVSALVRKFVAAGGDVSKAAVTCSGGTCSVTDGCVTCDDSGCSACGEK